MIKLEYNNNVLFYESSTCFSPLYHVIAIKNIKNYLYLFSGYFSGNIYLFFKCNRAAFFIWIDAKYGFVRGGGIFYFFILLFVGVISRLLVVVLSPSRISIHKLLSQLDKLVPLDHVSFVICLQSLFFVNCCDR